jgi:perosamine synthetase
VIPISEPTLGELERRYLLEAFDSGWISSRGTWIGRAETALQGVTESRNAAVVSNGTTALHLALLAAGVRAGDEVILPSSTYIATLNAVLYVGATPVIVDVDPATWCIAPNAVAAALTAQTAAVIAVDLYGHPADYAGLRAVLEGTKAVLIADAAESIGARIHGASAAAMADIATLSFFGNKVVTSGEGGAVLTQDPAKHEAILQLRNQGNNPMRRYFHDVLGYNYRMTNLAAAILTAQLERSSDIIDRRRAILNRYRARLSEVAGVTLQHIAEGVEPSPWLLTVCVDGADAAARDRVGDRMRERGVETRPGFAPVESMPYLRGAVVHDTSFSQRLGREALSLPTFPGLTDEQVDEVCEALEASLEGA